VKSFAFAGVLLALFCVTGVARAGDVAAYKGPPPAANVVIPGNFYAGLSLGGRWSDTDWTTTAAPSPQFWPVNSTSFNSGTLRVGRLCRANVADCADVGDWHRGRSRVG
jgi:hypothetical protein